MVTIRLSRGGSKKRPFYSILVSDQRYSAHGRFIERVGFYNPIAQRQEEKLRLDTARVDRWVSHGAKPSERVAQLYKQAKTQATAKPVASEPASSKPTASKPATAKPTTAKPAAPKSNGEPNSASTSEPNSASTSEPASAAES